MRPEKFLKFFLRCCKLCRRQWLAAFSNVVKIFGFHDVQKATVSFCLHDVKRRFSSSLALQARPQPITQSTVHVPIPSRPLLMFNTDRIQPAKASVRNSSWFFEHFSLSIQIFCDFQHRFLGFSLAMCIHSFFSRVICGFSAFQT